MIKLTARQVEVLRKLADGSALMLLDEGRHEFCGGGGRVGDKVLKPLFDADLLKFEHSNQTVELTQEGKRAARHGLSYEGPAESPLNVQEYARLKSRTRRKMRKDGWEQVRTTKWSDDPDECEIIEWWEKDGELQVIDFRPTPPCGACDVLIRAPLQRPDKKTITK